MKHGNMGQLAVFLPTFSGKSGSFEASINMWQLPGSSDLDLVFLAGDEVTELWQWVIFHGAPAGAPAKNPQETGALDGNMVRDF